MRRYINKEILLEREYLFGYGCRKCMERRQTMTAKRALIACLAAMVSIVGCTPYVISTDAGVYLNGTLYASSGKNTEAVYKAALQAMERLQLQVTYKAKDAFGGNVTGKTSDGKVITIKIEPTEQMRTKYTIHVGFFGDKERSQKIFDDITHALENPPGA